MHPDLRTDGEPARGEASPEASAGERPYPSASEPSGASASEPPDSNASEPSGAGEASTLAGPANALTRLLVELARTPDPAALAEVSQRRLEPGEQVGRFQLLREVGRGGFGVVFEARDGDLGRLVAFKAFRPGRPLDASQVEALRREAEAAAQLNHPNVVTVHDFGNCSAGPYVIMELLRGDPLSQRVEPGPLSPREAVRIASAVAQALVHAHAAGVIHRDLKPGNVFLCADGKVKVLDFGLARLLGSGGEKGGTPGYMAPEQCRGEAEDERTDLFGLGALLFRMLTGRLPYPVLRGRSAVLDPGPTPAPEGKGIPPRLSGLVRRMLERAPAARPGNALEVQDELAAVERLLDPVGAARRHRTWMAAGLALFLAAGGGALAGMWSRMLQARSLEHITVAVADFENATGDPQLDGLSGMLITSLEQSRKLSVLTRSRMRDELRKLGREDAVRLDESAAREVGKATGARALFLASMRRLGGTYAVELRALDPRTDEYLFTASERAASKEEVPAVIDRLSERARRELRERSEDVRENRVQMGAAVTRSLEAYQHYFAGMECLERPRENIDLGCLPHFRQAVAADPSFALAHFRLAFTASYLSLGTSLLGDVALVRQAMSEAVRLSDRVPAKERGLILALQARLEGDDEAAAARYQEVLSRYPDDKHVQYLAAWLRLEHGEYAKALPFLQRAVDLDPFFQGAVSRYVDALGRLGRTDELRARLEAWSRLAPNPALRAAAVRGAVWQGDLDGALASAEGNVASGGGVDSVVDLAAVQFSRGDFRLAQATLERALSAAPDHLRLGLYRSFTLAAQGRRHEALVAYDTLRDQLSQELASEHHRARAHLLAASGDAAAVWAEAREVLKEDATAAGTLAADLALLGDVPHARELASRLPQRTPDEVLAESALAWRAGDRAGARTRLKALEAVDPAPDWGLPPSFLLAEIAADAGEDVEVVEAAARFRTIWTHLGSRGGWTVPRMLFLEARSLARLGRFEEARRRLRGLVAEWARADADDGQAAGARALLASLDADAAPR